jgi:hypothetical protein
VIPRTGTVAAAKKKLVLPGNETPIVQKSPSRVIGLCSNGAIFRVIELGILFL